MVKRISYNELKKFSFKILLKSGIKNNIAEDYGGGINIHNYSSGNNNIDNAQILNNSANHGGGIY